MKKTTEQKLDSSTEAATSAARAVAEADAALATAITATTAARAAHKQAEANMKTVRPRNLKERQHAVLQTLAELNEADDTEAAARTALADAQRALDRVTMLDHVAAAEPVAARAALDAAVLAVVKHTEELRAEYVALDALLETQRTHALLAMRIARLNGWDANIAPLPAHLARALMLQAQHTHGGERIVWAAPLTDPKDLVEGVKAVVGYREPVTKWHEFRDSVGTPEQVVRLLIDGQLQPIADEWDEKHKREIEAGAALYKQKIQNYTDALAADTSERTDASRARVKAAREAFRPAKSEKPAKPEKPDAKRSPSKVTPQAQQSAEADNGAT
jgi:hypothetical protein